MINLAGNTLCDSYIKSELNAAGIAILPENSKGEVPYTVVGVLTSKDCVWKFTRAWYYWVARAPEGKGLRKEFAEKLNAKFGRDVRVSGYAGGVDVSFAGDVVDLYHVDTVEGLTELVHAIQEQSRSAE